MIVSEHLAPDRDGLASPAPRTRRTFPGPEQDATGSRACWPSPDVRCPVAGGRSPAPPGTSTRPAADRLSPASRKPTLLRLTASCGSLGPQNFPPNRQRLAHQRFGGGVIHRSPTRVRRDRPGWSPCPDAWARALPSAAGRPPAPPSTASAYFCALYNTLTSLAFVSARSDRVGAGAGLQSRGPSAADARPARTIPAPRRSSRWRCARRPRRRAAPPSRRRRSFLRLRPAPSRTVTSRPCALRRIQRRRASRSGTS